MPSDGQLPDFPIIIGHHWSGHNNLAVLRHPGLVLLAKVEANLTRLLPVLARVGVSYNGCG